MSNMLMGPQNLPVRLARSARTHRAGRRARRPECALRHTPGRQQGATRSTLIRAAAALGLSDFGESYLQEALAKIEALQDLALTWHFIGRCRPTRRARSPTASPGCTRVDRLRVAERLSRAAPLPCAAAERVPAGEPRRRAEQGRRDARASCRRSRAPSPPCRGSSCAASCACRRRRRIRSASGHWFARAAPAAWRASTRRVRRSTRSRWA